MVPRTEGLLSSNSFSLRLRRAEKSQELGQNHKNFLAAYLQSIPNSVDPEIYLGGETLKTLKALSGNRDTQRFFRGILSIAKDTFHHGRSQVGIGLLQYSSQVLERDVPLQQRVGLELTTKIREELTAMKGQGSLSRRAAYMFSDFKTHLLDPIQFGGFFLGIGAFQKARYVVGTRLLNPMVKSFWRNGLGTHILSFGAGLGAESAALTVGMRGIYQLAGHKMDWSGGSLLNDYLWTAGEMGILRGSFRLPMPHLAAFLGVTLTTAAKASFGQTRFDGDLPNILAESFSKYVHFTVGSFLFNRFQPWWFKAWHESTEAHLAMHLPRLGKGPRPTHGDWLPDLPKFPWPKPGWEGPNLDLASVKIPQSNRTSWGGGIRDALSRWAMVKKPKEEGPKKSNQPLRSTIPPQQSFIRGLNPDRAIFDMFEKVPLPILVTNPQGKILYVNPQVQEVLSKTQMDLIGKNFEDVFVKKSKGGESYGLKNEIGQGRVFEEKTQEWSGEEVVTIRYLKDVSRIRKLEDYRQIGERLRRGIHDSGSYLTMIGHFRDSMLPFMRKLYEEHGQTDPRYKVRLQWMNDFRFAVDRIIELHKAGRALMASEGRMAETHELGETVHLALRFQKHQQDNFKVEVQTEIEPGLKVFGNRGYLTDAISNLVQNAYEAMPGGGKLLVHAKRQAGELILELQDNGPGISPQHLSRVFDEHFTTKESGVGEGLNSVKRTVEEKYGGKIEVESEVGKGTTFRIFLPEANINST